MKKKSTQVVPKIDQVVTAMIDKNIKQLVEYGIAHELITEYDRIYVTNRILEVLKKDDYTEQARVAEGVTALEAGEFDHFLDVIKRSGDSSSKLLQNIYSTKDVHTQNVTVALGLSEYFLGKNGVCRVHGGGFAGTIQAFVKNSAVADYKSSIEKIFGEGSCHVLKVRPYGGIKVM